MLVLSRKAGQELVIGNAVVKVVRIKGKQVVIAVEAPRDVKVLRAELRAA